MMEKVKVTCEGMRGTTWWPDRESVFNGRDGLSAVVGARRGKRAGLQSPVKS